MRDAIRAWSIPGVFWLAITLAGSPCARAADEADFNTFRKKYHCEIVHRLAKLHAIDRPRDRYLILALVHHPYRFVQCIFHASGGRVLCEASSGFYTQKPGQPRMFVPAPETITALARLGFSTDDSKGNFQREMDTKSPGDLAAVADLLLAAIYEAYWARSSSALDIIAPLAPMSAGERARCVPIG